MFEQVPKLPGSRFTSLRAVYQAVVAAILIAMVHLMSKMSDLQRKLLCDPQTSGGLLLAVGNAGSDAAGAVDCRTSWHSNRCYRRTARRGCWQTLDHGSRSNSVSTDFENRPAVKWLAHNKVSATV